jgi:hypothetical protein
MSGMKRPSTTSLIISGIIMATGLAGLVLGSRLFVSGAAVADQTGDSGQMSGGVILALFGLFLLVTPPMTWVISLFTAERTRYGAWKQGLTPRERRWVETGETAALAGAAIGGYEANRAWARRIGERYMADQAAQAERDAMLMQAIQGTGTAGQPGAGAPGQPGQMPEPTPGQYQPYGD